MANANLHKAKKQKNDEFYTQYSDVENEVQHYKKHLKNKIVYCNCDDYKKSNFVKYFIDNFVSLGLKKLYAVGYVNQELALFNKEQPAKAYCLEYTDTERNIKPLSADGDFRSSESIEYLKQSDVVITNPPFSLFREYVAQLVEYDKKFLIIGSQEAIKYKNIFPLIKDNKIWLGINNWRKIKGFIVPKDTIIYTTETRIDKKTGNKIINITSCCWWTNINHNKVNEYLQLEKTYTPEQYPKYDNYDAINVNKTKDIPKDYSDAMGVPISFLNKYNSEQFEIIGTTDNGLVNKKYKLQHFKTHNEPYIKGNKLYSRIIIKHKPQEHQWQS